jgi:predicted nucleic acid-binding protein
LAWAGVEPFLGERVVPIPLSVEIAREAAEIRARHYHRTARPLSLADCVLLASGAAGDRLATADPHVLSVAADLGLEPIALAPEE